jgi:hypothetical protein
MGGRIVRTTGGIGFIALAGVLAACGGMGGSSPIAGKWTKTMSGEGEVIMTIAQNGVASFALPDGRWPAPVDIEATLTVKGDSLTISNESGPSSCAMPAPGYVVAVAGNSMTIGGGGSDQCGTRHAVLVGTWSKQ